MTQRHFVTASTEATDKKLDEFLDGLSSLVANAVADGIKAGLEAKGVQVRGADRAPVENHGQRFKSPAAAPTDGVLAFKVPKARD